MNDTPKRKYKQPVIAREGKEYLMVKTKGLYKSVDIKYNRYYTELEVEDFELRNPIAMKCLDKLDEFGVGYIVAGYNENFVVIKGIRKAHFRMNRGDKQVSAPYLGFVKGLRSKRIITERVMNVDKQGNNYIFSREKFDYLISMLEYQEFYREPPKRQHTRGSNATTTDRRINYFIDAIKRISLSRKKYEETFSNEGCSPQFNRALVEGTAEDCKNIYESYVGTGIGKENLKQMVLEKYQHTLDRYPFTFIRKTYNEETSNNATDTSDMNFND